MENYDYMVVDDDLTNNLICKLLIKKFDTNANITLFSKPEEGLAYVKEYFNNSRDTELLKPVVLFLDLNMPTMTGWEFLDEFVKFDPKIQSKFYIHILTSSIEDFTKEAELYPFVKGFLSKPLKMKDLNGIHDSFKRMGTFN